MVFICSIVAACRVFASRHEGIDLQLRVAPDFACDAGPSSSAESCDAHGFLLLRRHVGAWSFDAVS
jgi:hypothetical protein